MTRNNAWDGGIAPRKSRKVRFLNYLLNNRRGRNPERLAYDGITNKPNPRFTPPEEPYKERS